MHEPALSHFSLTSPPFTKEISDADLWMPASKVHLVDDLTECIQERRSALVCGEPGVGKTCVLRALRQRLPREQYRLTYCHNATLGRRDFYRQLCVALGLSPKATAAAVFFAVTEQVKELASARIHPVFFIDEAHLLHPDMLSHLHILLNYEWDSRALLSIVLVGLPELSDRLALSAHKSLFSRLHTRVQIDATAIADTTEYIRHRLALAGCERDLFTLDAISLLHEASAGNHRDLDRLATLALRESARRKKKLVERDATAAAIDGAARAG